MSVFEHAQKMELVKLLSYETKIDGRNNIMTNAIKIYVKSVFDAMNERDASLIKFPEYEL